MSKRTCRKRKTNDTELSSAWYVGYAEDGESVEAIMKKFEELEKLEQEVKPCSSTSTTSCQDALFNQSQLEELFKRTSAFTVKTTTLSMDCLDDDDLELWRLSRDGDWDGQEEEEEDDYQVWDDYDAPNHSTSSSQVRVKREKSSKSTPRDKEGLLLARYKSIQMQDRQGNFYFIKKKVNTIDPSLPTYVKIPNPIPRSWARFIAPIQIPTKEFCNYKETSNVLEFDLKIFGNQHQAILLDPPLLLKDEDPKDFPNKISIQQFGTLNIPSVIPFGFLFIWTEKELTLQVLKVCEKWGFKYVENFAWIKMDMGNKIASQPGKYFNKSKTTCLILRKEGEIDLRHQRSPDCEFDFIKPGSLAHGREEKPLFIYELIETLLPNAQFNEKEPDRSPRLLQLWSSYNVKRRGWSHLVESKLSSK